MDLKNKKINVNFDITTLNLLCSYIISGNQNIKRSHVINLKNLFRAMDMENYAGDNQRLARISFINKGIEARLEHNLTTPHMIITHIAGGIGIPIDTSAYMEINNDELFWINKTVSETLKYSIIYNDVDKLLSLCTRFKALDYADKGSIVQEIEQCVVDMQVKFRKSRADNSTDMTFSLTGDDYISSIIETYKQLSNPANKLHFGTQALNMLTGGGVEAGRVYTLLGLPGEGKSTTLIDMAIQIKRYNSSYVCKDPTKKPCVVLLVMENGIIETVQRIFSMCVGQDMLTYTQDKAIELLRSTGNLKVSDSDPVNLIVKYRPNLSEDTSYLYTMVEDLRDEGYETICVIQDYLKRIRSVDGSFNGDLRRELGAIINEFKIFATLNNIPVITASQLNRDATSHIDEARTKNKADLVRLLGRSNVGESNLILENSDWIGMLAPEYDKHGNKYLGLQRVKSRYFIPGDIQWAFIPYERGTIKFIEDLYAEVPVHKTTMREDIVVNVPNSRTVLTNQIKNFEDIKLSSDSNNIFDGASMIVACTYAKLLQNQMQVMAEPIIPQKIMATQVR